MTEPKHRLHLVINPDLMDKIRQAAERERRSINNWVCLKLEQILRKEKGRE